MSEKDPRQERLKRIAVLESALWHGLIEFSKKNGGEVDGWEASTALSRVLARTLELAQQQEDGMGDHA